MSKSDTPIKPLWRTLSSTGAAGFCLLLSSMPSLADIYKSDNLKIYGDFRTRVEADFDSQTAGGANRDDRDRLRVRARLGMNYMPTGSNLDFGLRLRSGSDNSQQSPHITVLDFDDNDTGDADFNYDKWYLKAKAGDGSIWVGRNSLPFWKQNELFWDDDVTPAGVGGSYTIPAGKKNKLELNAGYFSLPVGMQAFSGDMIELQAALHADMLTIAGGVMSIDANASDPDAGALLRGNGARDYRTWILSGQLRLKAADKPLKVGADIMYNSKNYSSTDPDPNTANNHDQTTGYDIFFNLGTTNPKDWLAGVYYANIEALAVNSSYAQDDWVRWGSATQTRATDMKGFEFRFAYGLNSMQNIVARLYFVESIKTSEDGNRLRVDWNVKF